MFVVMLSVGFAAWFGLLLEWFAGYLFCLRFGCVCCIGSVFARALCVWCCGFLSGGFVWCLLGCCLVGGFIVSCVFRCFGGYCLRLII